MHSWFLAIRELSAYTEDNILLGVFSDEPKRDAAIATYRSHMEKKDDHAKQGYMDVDLAKDITCFELQSESKNPSVILVETLEGFGQVYMGWQEGVLTDSPESAALVMEKYFPTEGFQPYVSGFCFVIDNLQFANKRYSFKGVAER